MGVLQTTWVTAKTRRHLALDFSLTSPEMLRPVRTIISHRPYRNSREEWGSGYRNFISAGRSAFRRVLQSVRALLRRDFMRGEQAFQADDVIGLRLDDAFEPRNILHETLGGQP